MRLSSSDCHGTGRWQQAARDVYAPDIWGGYPSTPDACASAAEIARRGLAGRAKIKDVLPCYDMGWRARRWQDVPLPAELAGLVKSTG